MAYNGHVLHFSVAHHLDATIFCVRPMANAQGARSIYFFLGRGLQPQKLVSN